jgi:hypothetical protein
MFKLEPTIAKKDKMNATVISTRLRAKVSRSLMLNAKTRISASQKSNVRTLWFKTTVQIVTDCAIGYKTNV